MKFQYTLNFISLLAYKYKDALYKIIKELGYLLLAVLFINSVPATKADDINNTLSSQYPPTTNDYRCLAKKTTKANCARYINLATAPTQRAFDYDPGMLPEVAEVIFALRIQHANAGKPYIINLSGNYLLKFTKGRIHILDMYTKNSDVYEYQSTNPNITLGLSISKGLPRHYKGIIIKEDAHGKLYGYAALRSDNISTDETMLSETLSHPFYEIAGQDGGEDEVTISKAMAFYHEVPSHSHSHSRHTRCVKESMGILEQIQQILGSGSLVCGPEADSDIRSANHQSAAEMKLDQPLVEAPVKTSKYPERLGYRLEKRWDLNGKSPVAVLAAANFCKVSVKTVLLGKRRQQRALDPDNCPHWVNLMVSLYKILGLRPSDVNLIVEAVKVNGTIPASYFPPGAYIRKTKGRRLALDKLIARHLDQAAEAIQLGAAISGEAAGASAFVECPDGSQSQAGRENATAGERLEIFALNGRVFIPEPNKVKTVKRFNRQTYVIMVNENERYTTKVIYLRDPEHKNNIDDIFTSYIRILDDWIENIKIKRPSSNPSRKKILKGSIDIASNIRLSLLKSTLEKFHNLVISVVYYKNNLIGISTGRIIGRTYHPECDIASPESLFGDDGSNRGQLDYLRSAVLRFLLLKGLIDKSELAVISKYSTGHDEPDHDEL